MDKKDQSTSLAQILLPSQDLNEDMNFFTSLGFLLDHIFPADDPQVAIMSGHQLHIRLDRNYKSDSPVIHLLTDHPESILDGKGVYTAPNGTRIEIHPRSQVVKHPPTIHKFEVRYLEDGDPWIIGRAGMLYRDLIPDRLGGSIIASHIRIPEGGPVPDMVHYHVIGFQLIYCYRGWVKLVYEDQGPPFILHAGDCVTQPPQIRHRVLESSDNLEVIEIGVPAEHVTTIDHDMTLPTETYKPNREFYGQKFCHHLQKNAEWKPWRVLGFDFRNTGIDAATKGVASVHVVKTATVKSTPASTSHHADIHFTFILNGSVMISTEKAGEQLLKKGDAFVVPPLMQYQLSVASDDLEFLEVCLPG